MFGRQPPPFLDSAIYRRLTGERRVVIVDGGARGELVPPLDRIRAPYRTVVRFEPDAEAEIVTSEGEIVLRKALWSHAERVKLHITMEPSCSSVYPPDRRLVSSFIDILGLPARNVRSEVEVDADSIDHLMTEAGVRQPDLIKLDIHSAEYEALQGAEQSLASSTVAILVECWPVPIHLGQRSLADLERLVASKGFLPFEVAVASWPRKASVSDRFVSKSQSVQFEVLYLKDVIGRDDVDLSVDTAVTLIGFAELFGQVAYALQVAEDCRERGILSSADERSIREELLRTHRVPRWRHLVSKVARRIQRTLAPLVLNVNGD
jgi:FkbM family methyltransferase